jgi:hypothetical protein
VCSSEGMANCPAQAELERGHPVSRNREEANSGDKSVRSTHKTAEGGCPYMINVIDVSNRRLLDRNQLFYQL